MGKYNIRQVIRGEYVATPIKNAFNDKISYWFSKNGCKLSIYMFTVGNGDTKEDFKWRLSQEGFNEFIPRLEERCKRPYNPEVYDEERKKINK